MKGHSPQTLSAEDKRKILQKKYQKLKMEHKAMRSRLFELEEKMVAIENYGYMDGMVRQIDHLVKQNKELNRQVEAAKKYDGVAVCLEVALKQLEHLGEYCNTSEFEVSDAWHALDRVQDRMNDFGIDRKDLT